MLHSLELENFKAFGERAHIQFAPITLIFGENSAGKSTVLQALYLLKQTLESREIEALSLRRSENGLVDLGSFQELLFDHDLERKLAIRVGTSVDVLDSDNSPIPMGNISDQIGIELSYNRPTLKEKIHLDQIGIYDEKSSNCIAKFQMLDKMTKVRVRFADFPHPLKPLTAAKCIWLTQTSEYWEPLFRYTQNRKEDFIKLLEYRIQNHSREDSQKDPHFLNDSLDDLINYKKFLSSDFDLQKYISKMRKGVMELEVSLGVHGFFPIFNLYDNILYGLFPTINLAIKAGEALKQTLQQLFPISPIRRLPERTYMFSGADPDSVGHKGDLLPDLLFRQPELVALANDWLSRLEFGHELQVNAIGDSIRELFEVRLIDTRRKNCVNVALADVGFGVSQLLPFVVQSLVSEKQIISIEQPEVHVHPRLQADLGDLLAEAIQKPRQNQFIIETHSEHLILRLQRLVYEKKIKPEDVSVIYISRGPEGAKSEGLRLDEEGDFIDEWPDGFFPERLRELR